MRWMSKLGRGVPVWRWAAALTLALALVGAQAASASSSGSAALILFAPGAPLGSQVQVQWLNPITNAWEPVSGWTGTLNVTTVSGVPFQAFAVLPPNYGQQMFRWVVFSPASNMATMNSTTAGGTTAVTSMTTTATTANTTNMAGVNNIWGTSSPFALPATDGVHLDITVFPAQVLQQTNTVINTTNAQTTNGQTTNGQTTNVQATNVQTTTAANTAPVTTLSTIIASLSCPPGGCNASAITGKFTGLPGNSWITVEWLDSRGAWEPVMGWQGQADFVDSSGKLVKQFGVFQANYGQGPFRWAIYNAPNGGSLLAVSPNFNLPSANGQNEIFNLAS